MDVFLREFQPGLICYVDAKINSIETMRRTNTHIREVMNGLPLPPIIALDQEGGNVARLTKNVVHFPSAMAMAASGDSDLVHRAGMALGRQAARAGCSMVFAPVLDLNLCAENPVIGTRAFSDNSDLVLRYGRAFSKGLQDAGVLPVAKHFPGHGRTSADSHFALPVVSASRDELLKSDFYVFRSIEEKTFPAVMTAHVVFSDIDSVPATLSRKIIHDWFQRECGYSGLVMTDAVRMQALSVRWSYPEIYRRALEAGCHLIITCMNYRDCREIVLACERMVAQGTIAEERIDAAALRVIEFKLQHQKYLQAPLEELTPERLRADRGADETLARSIAERALTLVQDPDGLLPLKKGVPIHLFSTSARFLQEARAAAGAHTLGVHMLVRGDLPAAQSAIREMRAARGVIVYAGESAGDTAFLASLPGDLRRPSVVSAGMIIIALDDPWFARRFMQQSAYLAAYSSVALSLEACARALFGLTQVRGRSPVQIAQSASQ
jgi:beta-N-acetylhexosaminidase